MERKLVIGESYTNNELYDMFHCKNSGGIRYSKTTRTLLLITNGTQKVYKDKLSHDGEILYVGEGLRGDQDLVRGNKILSKSRRGDNDVDDILFFESDGGYFTFWGYVYVWRVPYQEQQPDIDGNLRKVWIFPLKMIK